MENQTRFLSLLFIAILCIAHTDNTTKAYTGKAIITYNHILTTDGSIVVINDDGVNSLVVTTSNKSLITSIEIYDSDGSDVSSFEGCKEVSCQCDISKLDKGTYVVSVLTTSGKFSGNISI